MTLKRKTTAEASPKVLSPGEKSVMDKVIALGTPLGDWDVETDHLIQAMRSNSFAPHDDYSDLFSYLHALVNSSLIQWFLQTTHPTMKELDIESAPIAKISDAEQSPFIRLIDQILEAKSADPEADTSELDESIDWLVYDLYDLTDEETAVVSDYFWDGDMSQEEEDAALVKWIQEGITGEYVSREVVMETLRNPNGD